MSQVWEVGSEPPAVDSFILRPTLQLPLRVQGQAQLAKDLSKALPENSLFREWMDCWPTLESPKSYVLLGAMSMLGAALGRNVYIDQDAHMLYPMLNLLLIGRSGLGKSTAIKVAWKHLVGEVPKLEQPQFIAGSTPEKLHNDLRANPQAVLFASELANFFTKQKYMESMIPYVTELLDYPDTLQRRTVSGGVVEVLSPSVTVVGGSTVEWLQGQLPDSATSGGFLARFLICYEENPARKIGLAKHELTRQQVAQLLTRRERVAEQFAAAAKMVGEVTFEDYAAVDIFNEWYANLRPINGHLAPFAARAREFVLRLAMLSAISCGRTTIGEQDVQAGIEIYEYCAARLQQVVVPFSIQGKLIAQVLQVIGDQALSPEEIYQAMRNSITAQEVQKLLIGLEMSKDIKRNGQGKIERVSGRT